MILQSMSKNVKKNIKRKIMKEKANNILIKEK